MREIDWTSQFKKDYKREKKNQRGASLDADLGAVLDLLVQDSPLRATHQDHALSGEWKDFRDCHVRPDLVLIYRKKGKSVLELARLGSHAQLTL